MREIVNSTNTMRYSAEVDYSFWHPLEQIQDFNQSSQSEIFSDIECQPSFLTVADGILALRPNVMQNFTTS